MAGDDNGVVGQSQNRRVQRTHDLLQRAARQVGAADGTGEECVTSDEFLLAGKVQADASFGVSGRVQNAGVERTGTDSFTAIEAMIDLDVTGIGHSNPSGLDI